MAEAKDQIFAFIDTFGDTSGDHPARALLKACLRHPALACRAVAAVRRLASVTVELSDTPEGRFIRDRLLARLWPIRTGCQARAALILPATAEQYFLGRSRRALRTNINAARRLGISCRQITHVSEQQARCVELLAERQWAGDPLERLAKEHGIRAGEGRYYAAVNASGRTVALAVVMEDAGTACLVFMIATVDLDLASPARYALTGFLVRHLIESRVQVLLITEAPASSAGLRYFQQRLGFDIVNVRVHPAECFSTAPHPAASPVSGVETSGPPTPEPATRA